jgi:(R,R)-butanediol dehydrogenase/meso-butanediol dehydrogenase/diacetyl reductase
MKAAVWHGRKDVRVEDVPEPSTPQEGWVKIKVQWCGICGSDLHEYLAGPIFIPTSAHPLTGHEGPVILGHEFSGEIVEIGAGVTNVKVGDRVAPDACQHCGECKFCQMGRYNICEKLAFTGLMTNGAFAEYVNVPAELCYVLPTSVDSEAGALIEPLAVGFHAVKQAGDILGDTVVILGGGTIGLSTLQAVKTAGAARAIVIEMSAARKEKAKECGADIVLDPADGDVVTKVRGLTDGYGADVVIECIGNKVTGPLAVDLVRKAGTVVMVGIFEEDSAFNFFGLTATEKKIVGSLAYTLSDYRGVAACLADGRMVAEPMVTGKITLSDIVTKGFEELVNNKDANIKIIVSPE